MIGLRENFNFSAALLTHYVTSDLPQGVCKVRATRQILHYALRLLSLSAISRRSRPTARRRTFNLSLFCLTLALAAGGLASRSVRLGFSWIYAVKKIRYYGRNGNLLIDMTFLLRSVKQTQNTVLMVSYKLFKEVFISVVGS